MRSIIVMTSLLLTGCSHMANDAWSGQDKAQHFLASAMLSAAGRAFDWGGWSDVSAGKVKGHVGYLDCSLRAAWRVNSADSNCFAAFQ